ncbi:MAG: hypothetical protein O2960_17770, partial [Verrucomicrobia bacterium]|nr:hypothetical protein [Verrucomicrobiota bacterium]
TTGISSFLLLFRTYITLESGLVSGRPITPGYLRILPQAKPSRNFGPTSKTRGSGFASYGRVITSSIGRWSFQMYSRERMEAVSVPPLEIHHGTCRVQILRISFMCMILNSELWIEKPSCGAQKNFATQTLP